MLKIFMLLLMTLLTLEARDNPFFPSTGEFDIPANSDQLQKNEPLKRVTITLPSSARVLESITVKYKNLDGSIVLKTEKLGNSIDWHLPLFVSQNIGGSLSRSTKKIQEKFKKLAGVSFITLYESKKSIKLVTKDKMIRNFLLIKPHRIVCDFKRSIDIRSYEKDIDKGIVKRVRLGNHKGYYRVVIELDGYYRYKTEKLKNGYKFRLL